MKKFLHSLLVLFMGINTVAFAQQEEAATITAWDGSDEEILLAPGEKLTFSYTATAEGILYIYADNQSENDNVPLSIWGGWYQDGAYNADFPLSEAGNYDNGLGVYGWIKVYSGDVIRFTIAATEEAVGELTEFTLKSSFFTNDAGSSWEKPVALPKDTKMTLQPFQNTMEALEALRIDYATWCSFTAPHDGVASIYTEEYLVYYIQAEEFGMTDALPKPVPQDESTNDHEFMVKGGKEYLVFVPNSRPAEVTFKMTQDRLGLSEKFPIVIDGFPAELNLAKGNNYYRLSHELIGDSTILEVAVAAGWNGAITYFDATNWNAYESEELTADAVLGDAATFCKNIDTRFLDGSAVVVNFKVTDQAEAKAVLTLRMPAESESFATATAVTLGENAFEGPARDYWFACTAEADAELSFASSATIKHINFAAGVEMMVPTNVYRVSEGETVYICVAAKTDGNHTLTITSKEIVAGDYCDRPIEFKLGENINIEGRGVDNFHLFTAEQTGFAIFNSPGWSISFREECGAHLLDPQRTEDEDKESGDIALIYKLPITEGQSYIVEVQSVSEDVTISTGFEEAVLGDVCATAIAIETMDTLELSYEFGVEKWYKVTAEKNGYFTIYAKLGYSSNMKTKVGNCDAAETNAPSDNSHDNAYMGGYKAAKVYVEEGQTLYIYTKTGSENDEDQFGKDFYIVPTFAEPRPGENVNIAIQAQESTAYEVMANDANGYEQWYAYTIPAGEDLKITQTAQVKFITNALAFYKEDKTTSMSLYKGDYTQTNITNDAGETIGKNYSFEAADAEHTIYIKVSTVNAMYVPVVWYIGDAPVAGGIEAPEAGVKAPVIYDLMGRRVENPTKGIYIINGVKRVIK